jgi:hypothetical protein
MKFWQVDILELQFFSKTNGMNTMKIMSTHDKKFYQDIYIYIYICIQEWSHAEYNPVRSTSRYRENFYEASPKRRPSFSPLYLIVCNTVGIVFFANPTSDGTADR